jgi:hypothetical protein
MSHPAAATFDRVITPERVFLNFIVRVAPSCSGMARMKTKTVIGWSIVIVAGLYLFLYLPWRAAEDKKQRTNCTC